MKTAFTVFVLALLPGLAAAQCGGHDRQAMSCAEGSIYDAETGTCEPVTTS
ncbi:hypothetical protein [Histidinibacterium aquaticum]|uniref:hypothetical protein n=1 Tax=Histidinibacterium aquaticum TaxID=2613962 RepID=UPI00168B893D|nr:hypothetical protein [Histidinibacterium aquaticum]